MAKGCGSKCVKAPTPDGEPMFDAEGRKKMISMPGNKKFPAGKEHPQCESCALEEFGEEIKWKWKIRELELFAKFVELAKKYETVKKK